MADHSGTRADDVERLVALSPDLLAIADVDGRFRHVNPTWERVLGWTRDELLATPFIELFHPDDAERVRDEVGRLATTGEDRRDVEVRLRAKDGAYRWLRGSIRPDIEAGLLYVSASDVTDRRRVEDQLRFRVAMEELVASISAALIGADPSSLEAEVENGLGRFAVLLGADRAYLLHMFRTVHDARIVEWCGPGIEPRGHELTSLPEETRRWWSQVIERGEPVKLSSTADQPSAVTEVMTRQQVRSVLVVPLRSRRAVGAIGLATVTHERDFDDDAVGLLRVVGETFLAAFDRADIDAALADARRELELRNDDLERTNLELERFAFSAAHDLKAPLSRIEMALNAVARTTADLGGETATLLDIARRGAERLRTLIEDLLGYAAIGKAGSEPEPVDLGAVVDQVISDLSATIASTGATVDVEPLPTVEGHRSLLTVLIQNLLSNALKFVPPGVEPRVRISAERDATSWTVSIDDNGVGIDPADRVEVFSMFTRLHGDDRYSGNGIGLATCAKVVSLHGGRIWIEDSPLGGSRFRFQIPG